jgi:hypothetical protein
VPTYFCDGVKGVTILNGVARIEFHRLQTVERGDGREAQMVSEMIVALPAQGLLQALAMLERVRDELIKEGLLKPAELAAPEPPRPAKSPNFS